MRLQAAIQGLLMDWELGEHSLNTIRFYRSCLNVFARCLEQHGITTVDEVTIAHSRAFMLYAQQRPADEANLHRPTATDGRTLTTATLQSYVKSIKVLFHCLVDDEVFARNPALRLHKPTQAKRVVVTFTHQHLNAMFEACDLTNSLGFRDSVLMLVLLDTGLRQRSLRHPARRCARRVPQSLQQRARGRDLPDHCEFLWKYVHLNRATADDSVTALFTNFAGHPLRPSGVEKIVLPTSFS